MRHDGGDANLTGDPWGHHIPSSGLYHEGKPVESAWVHSMAAPHLLDYTIPSSLAKTNALNPITFQSHIFFLANVYEINIVEIQNGVKEHSIHLSESLWIICVIP